MWEPLQRFKDLEPHARGLFLRAASVLPLISLSLRLRGFRATQSSLEKSIPAILPVYSNQQDREKTERAELTARTVRSAVFRSFGKATCLEKSLALWWLLSRQGIASSVRIGARKIGEKFEAHAWVEYDGIVLNEREEPHRHYAVFDEAFSILDQGQK